MQTKKCGDCIHADICKELNGGWFSAKNIAYCKGFKDLNNYVKVVRCKDCKMLHSKIVHIPNYRDVLDQHCTLSGISVYDDDFCSYGERKDNG